MGEQIMTRLPEPTWRAVTNRPEQYVHHLYGTATSKWYRLQMKNPFSPNKRADAWTVLEEDAAEIRKLNVNCIASLLQYELWVEAESTRIETLLIMQVGDTYDVERVVGSGTIAIITPTD